MRLMQELHWVDSSQLFRAEVAWTPLATDFMSDLADAVFGGQLLGHVMAGQELTTSVIADAAMTADLASHMVVDADLSSVEHEVMQAKVANHVSLDGDYEASNVIGDHLDSQIASDLVEYWIS